MSEAPNSPQPQAKSQLLPGVAAIALYMLFMTGINAFGALSGLPQMMHFSSLGFKALAGMGKLYYLGIKLRNTFLDEDTFVLN